MTPRRFKARTLAFAALALTLVLSGCGRNMYDQPRAEALESSRFFADGAASQALPEGVISRERGSIDPSYFSGMGDAGFATELPFELTEEVLVRGQERYNIYCSMCHNYDGSGGGVVVQKGFVPPASFHEQRLLDSGVGYFYNAITNGFGRMYSYASRIPVEDRWAIAAYVKAMQLSQNATVDDIPEEVLENLRSTAGEVR